MPLVFDKGRDEACSVGLGGGVYDKNTAQEQKERTEIRGVLQGTTLKLPTLERYHFEHRVPGQGPRGFRLHAIREKISRRLIETTAS